MVFSADFCGEGTRAEAPHADHYSRATLQHLLCLPLQEILISMIFTMHLCFFPGIVVGVFYLCWIPFMVAVILSAFFKNLITPVVVLVISTLVYSNSATNPILYGYLNREFRLPYKRLFSKVFWPCKWMVHAHQGRLRSRDLSTFSVGDVTGHSPSDSAPK